MQLSDDDDESYQVRPRGVIDFDLHVRTRQRRDNRIFMASVVLPARVSKLCDQKLANDDRQRLYGCSVLPALDLSVSA